MADQFVQVAPNSTGLKVDTSEITVGANVVERQRINIGDPTSATGLAFVGTPNTDSDAGDIALSTETYLKGWNGTTWDRARMATTGGLAVAGNDGTTYRNIKTATDGTLLINGVQDARTAQSFTTSAAASNAGVAVSNRNVVTFTFAGTYATFTVLFEASDDGGTNYYPLQAINNATGQAGSSATLAANASATYDAAVGGYTQVRVRTAAGPATGTCNVGLNTQVFAYDPVVAAIAQGVSAAGTAAAGNPVNIGAQFNTAPATATTGQATALLSDANGRLIVGGAAASAAAIAGNPVLMGGTFTTTLPTVTTGQAVNLQTTARGEQLVAISSGATAVAVKAASTAAAATDPALVVSLSPNSAIKIPTPNALILSSAATTNAISITPAAGTLMSVTANNTGAAVAFVKIYNLAAAPTVGTSVPALTIAVPAAGFVNLNFGAAGMRFSVGIASAITNLGTDADATAVTAAQVKLLVSYI